MKSYISEEINLSLEISMEDLHALAQGKTIDTISRTGLFSKNMNIRLYCCDCIDKDRSEFKSEDL